MRLFAPSLCNLGFSTPLKVSLGTQCPRFIKRLSANFIAVWFFTLTILHGGYAQSYVPFVVDNPKSFLSSEWVEFGIPLGFINETDESHFFVVDDEGDVVPADFKALSREGGDRKDTTQRIVWLGVKVYAQVSGGSPQSSRQYFLVHDANPPSSTESLGVNETSLTITLNPTSEVSFEINKTSPLFSDIQVGGTSILSSPSTVEYSLLPNSPPLPVTVDSTEIEEMGTYTAVIKQKMHFLTSSSPSDRINLTLRLWFGYGSNRVKWSLIISNPKPYGNFNGAPDYSEMFEGLWFRIPISNIGLAKTTLGSYQLSQSDNLLISQDFNYVVNSSGTGWNFNENLLDDFKVSVDLNNVSTTLNDFRFNGVLYTHGSGGGLGVKMVNFWQKFPASLGKVGDSLVISPYPPFGNGPEVNGQYGTPFNTSSNPPLSNSDILYVLQGGREIRHTGIFFVSSTEPTEAALSRLDGIAQKPLSGRANPGYLEQIDAFGKSWVAQRQWGDVGRERAERLNKIWVDDSAADNQPGLGKIGYPLFISRGGTYGHMQSYG
ncbi:MAG: hypothetical protein D6808_05440, partial [Candidatus Dadabacteria bacterium]